MQVTMINCNGLNGDVSLVAQCVNLFLAVYENSKFIALVICIVTCQQLGYVVFSV